MSTKTAPGHSRPQRIRVRTISAIAGIIVCALLGTFYLAVLPGLSIARKTPPALETLVATWLLRHSVPEESRRALSPLGQDVADRSAGEALFAQKCAACHAYDGGGKTEMGAGVYPRPPALHAIAQSMTDGEIFYHIRNGIRNTAMPAWNMPDRQLWQLVAYIRHLPNVAVLNLEQVKNAQAGASSAHYVGSGACRSCHEAIYARWSKTRMARVVLDPKTHPEAIIPDFSKPNPLLSFAKGDVAFVYGSVWKQRYFKKVGDDYFPLPAQWDILNKRWLPYHVPASGGDWWASFYPDPKGDNSGRPTGPTCDGCHSVNYNIETKTPSEWNVGCERCHGAGSEHVAHPTRQNILNPARMDYVHANDTCIQCHSQGQPLHSPIGGKYYDWPVGFQVGLNLADYWRLDTAELGRTTFEYFADGTAHKNWMQGNDFVQSLMYTRGVTCFSCHDSHGTDYPALLRKPLNEVCLTCHGPNTQNGPHAASIEAHTHHKTGSPGSQCVACHMPKIEEELPHVPDMNVSSHTFRFITPGQTERVQIPNACNACHLNRTTAWASSALGSWSDRSPWRVAQ